MRNGDPRSAIWIRRHLPAYLKDNAGRKPEDIQTLLSLVLRKEVPLYVIAGWSPEERLLADDWAQNVHWSASDNINRVPAKPPFLAGYD